MATEAIQVSCCIVGGGPAGMMLGFLLARAGVDVTVLEKHADFLRDFRGDTIHPSSLEVLHELGLLTEFLELPHQKAYRINGRVAGRDMVVGDFSHLPVTAPYIAFIPQWDFLEFLSRKAAEYPAFHLLRRTEATDLITGADAVTAGGTGDGTVTRGRAAGPYRPGLLCIGDAAHAMSPVGGIGINLAIQDAVAAANLLAAPLRQGQVSADDLRAVQRRRELPTRLTQRLQVFIQDRVLNRILAGRVATGRVPLPVRLLARFP